jgi:hypothetical protein
VDRPWNNIVLAFDFTAPTLLTVGDIIAQLRTQALAEYTVPLSVRLYEARVWELTGANVALEIYSCTQPTISAVTAVLTEHDQPGRNHWACCGLVWPKSHQQEPLGANQLGAVVIGINTVAATSTLRLHLKLAWRAEQQSLPTRLNGTA